MKAAAKLAIVVGGYALALGVAYGATALYALATAGPDRQAYPGMVAFGDGLLFLGVFGVAAVPATGAGLWFLREWRAFWVALAALAVAWSVTGVAAVLAMVARLAGEWTALAPLRLLVAPLFAMGALLAMAFAPGRATRIALLGVAGSEALAFALALLFWARPT